ncbi:HNH endonuclease [Candidatus Dojkabacteria bacterium]|jgi:hypothetical protein|nr:HNH endonuclease [Candidatus Dojkabacteria bacterium]
MNKELRNRIKELDGNMCRVYGCGITEGLDVHHLVPVGAGGRDEEGNLITICRKHHNMIKTGETSSLKILDDISYKKDFRWLRAHCWLKMVTKL